MIFDDFFLFGLRKTIQKIGVSGMGVYYMAYLVGLSGVSVSGLANDCRMTSSACGLWKAGPSRKDAAPEEKYKHFGDFRQSLCLVFLSPRV